jgi:hypothetical protein
MHFVRRGLRSFGAEGIEGVERSSPKTGIVLPTLLATHNNGACRQGPRRRCHVQQEGKKNGDA